MSIVGIIFGFVFAVCGFLLILDCYRVMKTIRGMHLWGETEGIVTTSELITKKDSDGDTFEPLVEYAYKVDGEKYKGDKIHPIYESTSEDDAKFVLSALKKGTKVKVIYNPDNHSEAFLARGYMGGKVGQFPIGFIFTCMGLMAMFPPLISSLLQPLGLTGTNISLAIGLWIIASVFLLSYFKNNIYKTVNSVEIINKEKSGATKEPKLSKRRKPC